MKTQNVFAFTLTALSLSALMACAPPNRRLEPALEVAQSHSLEAKLNSETTSEVDILFVIDNSRSMAEEQQILQNNVGGFVNALKAMKSDYRIGVVSVYDQVKMTPGSASYWANGKLRPLKTSAELANVSVPAVEHTGCTTTDSMMKRKPNWSPGFVTSEMMNSQGGLKVLQDTLKVGILCLDHGGPLQEELFTPVLAAVSPSVNKENKNFVRDGAHLAVVIVSDAVPSHRDPKIEEFVSELRAVKGHNPRLLSLHVIGVTAKDVENSAKGKTCRVDYDLESKSNAAAMEELVKGNGAFLRLCDANWGSKLTNISADIKRRLLNKTVNIDHDFDLIENGTLKVYVNGVDTAPGRNTWSRSGSRTIVFSDKMDLGPSGEADVKVTYTLLTERNIKRAAANRNLAQ